MPEIERTEYSSADIEAALQGYSLLAHQPDGIAHLLQRTSALLADDMGLGKTRQAVIAASIRAAGKPILVITLATLLINWQREFALPIDQQGGQGDDQNWPARRSDRSGDDRLAGLAQSHVVGQQGAGSLQQVSDAGRLVGQ